VSLSAEYGSAAGTECPGDVSDITRPREESFLMRGLSD